MRIDGARLRLQIAVLAAISAANVATFIGLDVRVPIVIYNASGSAPLDFYRLEDRLPKRVKWLSSSPRQVGGEGISWSIGQKRGLG